MLRHLGRVPTYLQKDWCLCSIISVTGRPIPAHHRSESVRRREHIRLPMLMRKSGFKHDIAGAWRALDQKMAG